MILANGAVPIQAMLDFQPEEGMVPHRGFVLARKNRQFVTWECGKTYEDEAWNCESGHYFDKFEEAQFDLGLRAGREFDRSKNEALERGLQARLR